MVPSRLYQWQGVAVELLLSSTRAQLIAKPGAGYLATISTACGRLSPVDTILIVTPKSQFRSWAHELSYSSGLGPGRYHLLSPEALRNDCERLGHVHTAVFDGINRGAATTRAMASVANKADRVWVRDVDVRDMALFHGKYETFKLERP